uniref:50S ribosomal protein L5 n=1 Tax=Nannochloropsis oculata TaxID=43925 RepID=A0A023PKT7_9STRA|nr:50S ribosomal protein L5 [Nannochloropsis oculata]
MYTLKYYYEYILKQDFLTIFTYQNSLKIPLLNKIVLNFGASQSTFKNLLPSLAAILLLSSQNPCIVISKKTTLTLKVKGGVAIGCKIDLRGANKFLFFEKLVFSILPRIKNFRYIVTENNVFFKLDNLFLFKEIEKKYDYFQDLPQLNVNVNFKAQNPQEVLAFLSACKFPSLS